MALRYIVAVIAFLSSTVSGHIALSSPVPFGHPDTSPLSPSGSNFPCKTDNGFGFSTVTNMKVGDSQTIAFSGTAVHNGGSCQLSLTPGYKPTTSSQFKVILSIEGGCPGLNGQTTTYDYKIPEEIPNGNYTFGWTWYNNIGNREIYMNCAPISITGSSQVDSKAFDALPDIAVFNIPSISPCGTKETFDVKFPTPGRYLITGSTFKPADPTNCNVAMTNSTGSGSSSAPSGSASNGGAASPASSATSVASSFPSSAAVSGGSSSVGYGSGSSAVSSAMAVSSATAAAAATSAVASSVVASSVAASSVVVPASAATSAASGGTGSAGGTTACSTHGAMICSSDGTMFGLCNFGKAVWQQVAAGTKCSNGQIGFARRSAKFRA